MPATPYKKSERTKHLCLAGSSDFVKGRMEAYIKQAETILADLDPDSPQRPALTDLVRAMKTTHGVFSESLAEHSPTHGAIELG